MANDNRPNFCEPHYRIKALLLRVLLLMPYQFRRNVSQSRQKRYEGRKRATSARLERCVEMMQTRAHLEVSLTCGSLALSFPALFTLLHCIVHVLYCANRGSPEVQFTLQTTYVSPRSNLPQTMA